MPQINLSHLVGDHVCYVSLQGNGAPAVRGARVCEVRIHADNVEYVLSTGEVRDGEELYASQPYAEESLCNQCKEELGEGRVQEA